jgi:RHH-type proline utilization regulon transcriptional repressor/proline dehydrogenase/delta 1-pyrroline-5-carboxylate dehydrogenase
MAEGRALEFQRLHGMGDALYAEVHGREGFDCRIYAPVGSHKELLAYLVRRLLENGANSSFVNAVNDASVPIDNLLTSPSASLNGVSPRHRAILRPAQLFGARKNSRGVEFGSRADLQALTSGVAAVPLPIVEATPLEGRRPAVPSASRAEASGGRRVAVPPEGRPVLSPADGSTVVGTVVEADASIVEAAIETALAAFPAWDDTPAEERAAALERAADLIEAHRDRLIALLAQRR